MRVLVLIKRGKALAEDMAKAYSHIALLQDNAPDAVWHAPGRCGST